MTTRSPRAAVLLAACALLAAPGCQGGPLAWTLDLGANATRPTGTLRTAAPNVSLDAPVTPSSAPATNAPGSLAPATVGPTAVTPSAARPTAAPTAAASARATPTAEPSFAPPATDAELPGAQTYSDVEPAEQQAVEAAIAADPDLAAYLPADLIHDGGVVLYRLAQVGPPPGGAGPVSPNFNLNPPLPWSRAITAKSGAQLILRKGCLVGKRPVRARIEVLQRGTMTYQGRTTAFGELVSRTIVLRPVEGDLKLAEASPLTAETQDGRSGLEFKQLAILTDAGKVLFEAGDVQKAVKAEDEPKVAPGERLRVEVELPARPQLRSFVYASRSGEGRNRLILRDTGVGGDRKPGDNRFSVELTAAKAVGLHHLVVEAIDPESFRDGARLRAFSVAIAYRVK